MANVAIPSIATATPAAADTVLGVQGGAVKRFSVSDLVPMHNARPNFGIASGVPFFDFTGSNISFWTPNGGSGSLVAGTLYDSAALLTTGGASGNTAKIQQSGLSFTVRTDDVLLLAVDNLTFSNNDNIRIVLSSDGFSTKSAVLTSTMKSVHGSRHFIPLLVNDATLNGGESLSNTFNYIGVELTANSAAVASARVLGVIKNPQARPKILIDWDDGFLSQYTVAFRYMAKYGLVGSVGVISDTTGISVGDTLAGSPSPYDYCSIEQLEEMYEAGWDMLTHGYYNHSAFGSRAALLADVAKNRDFIAGTGMTRAHLHYILPGGQVSTSNDTLGVLAEAGMLSGRTVDGNPQATHPLGVDTRYGLWSRTISQNATAAGLLAHVDRAISVGATVRLHGHRVLPGGTGDNEIDIGEFATLIDGIAERVRAGKVDNITMSQWASRVALPD